jgi:restriction system protein
MIDPNDKGASVSAAWVIRSGRYGERDAWALKAGYSGGGWQEVPDLTQATTRDQVGSVVAQIFADTSAAVIANYTGQVWALRGRVVPGDLMVMPLKTTKQIAIGRVIGEYQYLSQEPDLSKRHVVKVDWIITDLPRTSVKQDLLYTLGSALSTFAPTKNHAVARLEELLRSGTDPGQSAFQTAPKITGSATSPDADEDDVDEPELHTDIVEVARDQIRAKIAEEFSGHELTALVTAMLEAEGFTCTMSPPGADGGIDIVAGRGLLGMDAPRLVVQVKSGGQIGDPVVRDLSGVMHDQNADQGLLVAWGGLSKQARATVQGQQFRMRVWTAEDVIDGVLRVYESLPEDIRSRIPLKRVWMLAD